MRRSPSLVSAIWLSFLTFDATAVATRSSESAVDGKMLLQKYCSRCHSIDATRQSPLQLAPPLREIYLRYPIEQLEYGFAEGMGSKHREMPQIQFSSEQVSAIVNYLGSITGVTPSAAFAWLYSFGDTTTLETRGDALHQFVFQ